MSVNHEDVVDWVKSCQEKLKYAFRDDFDSLLLIESFVTQYEIRAKALLYKSRIDLLKEKISSTKQTIISSLKILSGNSRNFSPLNVPPEICIDKEPIDLFFWPFQESHLQMISELYQNLSKRMEVLAGTTNPPILGKFDLYNLDKCFDFEVENIPRNDYRNDLRAIRILEFSKQIEGFSKEGKTIKFEDVLKDAWRLWYGLFDQSKVAFYYLLRSLNPKGIFIGNDITLVGAVVVRLAQKNGIITYSIMHGSIKNPLWQYSKVDYFFVFGPLDRDLMINRGIAPQKLIVSGSPKLEKFLVEGKNTFDSFEIILVALSGPGHSVSLPHHLSILKVFENLAREMPEEKFVFKLHKKDKKKYYRKLKGFENVIVIEYDDKSKNQNIYYWIKKSKAVISGVSTSLLEAMYFKRPAISIDLLGELQKEIIVSTEITLNVNNYDELVSCIRQINANSYKITSHLEQSTKYIENVYSNSSNGSLKLISEKIFTSINEGITD
ncbi:MAG: hypothetical protein ACON5K_11900 [Bacteroidia bacterium]